MKSRPEKETSGWEPLDLQSAIEQQLSAIREKAEAAIIQRLEQRRELRLIGR